MIFQAIRPFCGVLHRLTVGTTNRQASFIHSDKWMESDAVLEQEVHALYYILQTSFNYPHAASVSNGDYANILER